MAKAKLGSSPSSTGKSPLSPSARQDAPSINSAQGAPIGMQRPAAAIPITPPTPPTKTVPPQPLNALGDVATISQIAQFLEKDISEVVSKMAIWGFRNVQPSTKMNVKFVTGLFQQGTPRQPNIVPVALQDSPSASDAISFSSSQTKDSSDDNSQAGQSKLLASASKEDSSQLTQPDTVSMTLIDGGVVTSPPEQSKGLPPTDSTKKPVLQVAHNITVQDLAALLGVKTHVIVADLLSMRVLRHAHQSVSELVLRKLCRRRGFEVTIIRK
jgi:hypothetical protein